MLLRYLRQLTVVICITGFALPCLAKQFELTRDNGSSITFYLEQRMTKPADSLLILLQGSDCNSVANIVSLNNDLPQVLPNADVLTVEKYGLTSELPYSKADIRPDGCPTEYVDNNSPHQRVKDLIQVMEFVNQGSKYRNIVVLGASEGAMVGEMFTAEYPKVTALISLVGGANYLLDDMRYFMTKAIPAEELPEQLAGFEEFIQQILTSDESLDLGPDSEYGFNWYRSILSVGRYDSLKQINQPVLLVDCGDDINTSPAEADKLYQQLQNEHKSNIKRITYPELNHFFTDKSGKRHIEQVINDCRNWLMTSLAKSPM